MRHKVTEALAPARAGTTESAVGGGLLSQTMIRTVAIVTLGEEAVEQQINVVINIRVNEHHCILLIDKSQLFNSSFHVSDGLFNHPHGVPALQKLALNRSALGPTYIKDWAI
jgi:hypothetical protein